MPFRQSSAADGRAKSFFCLEKKRMKTLLLALLLLTTAVTEAQDNLTIQVHEGIELMSVVQYLGSQLNMTTPSPYRKDIARFFLAYRNHPAVNMIFSLTGPVYPDLTECGLAFYNFPDIRLRPLPDSCPWFRYIPRDTLDAYLRLVMQFYKDSHFHDFFVAEQETYGVWAASLRASVVEPIRIFDSLIDTHGDSRWLVCMDPLNGWGAHTIQPRNVNPTYSGTYIYQLGYFGDTDSLGRMTFGANIYDLAWHEGTHAFTDPLLRKWAKSIDSLAALFPASPALREQNVNDWAHYFDELLPRAVSVALHRRFRSQEAYKKVLTAENERGFIHVGAVADVIYDDFIATRKVRDFDALMPRILATLRATKR
jgi:hypothetical protein